MGNEFIGRDIGVLDKCRDSRDIGLVCEELSLLEGGLRNLRDILVVFGLEVWDFKGGNLKFLGILGFPFRLLERRVL